MEAAKRKRGRPALPPDQKKQGLKGNPLVRVRVDPEIADWVHEQGSAWLRDLLAREYANR